MAETYRSTARMTAREAKVGETVVTWNGPVRITKENLYVVTDPENADVTIMDEATFKSHWTIENPRITSISKTDKGYTVFFEDATNAWYSDAQFLALCNGFTLSVTLGVTTPLSQTIGSVVGSGQTTIV